MFENLPSMAVAFGSIYGAKSDISVCICDFWSALDRCECFLILNGLCLVKLQSIFSLDLKDLCLSGSALKLICSFIAMILLDIDVLSLSDITSSLTTITISFPSWIQSPIAIGRLREDASSFNPSEF